MIAEVYKYFIYIWSCLVFSEQLNKIYFYNNNFYID